MQNVAAPNACGSLIDDVQGPFSVTIPKDGHFNDRIPGWGTGKLVALVSAEVLSIKNISMNTAGTPSFFGTPQTYYLQLTLKNGTLTDWTDQVSSSGHVSLRLASTESSYRLFAFYEFLSHEKNLDYSSEPSKTIWDNGSYVVDHYSARGAQTTIKFWEKYLLTDEIKQLLMDVGNYGEWLAGNFVYHANTKQAGKTASRSSRISRGRHRCPSYSDPNMDTT